MTVKKTKPRITWKDLRAVCLYRMSYETGPDYCACESPLRKKIIVCEQRTCPVWNKKK